MEIIATSQIMEDYTKSEQYLYEKAKKRANEIKGFYYNLTAYCIIIPIIIACNLIFMPEYHFFWFSMLGWGTGLLIHGMGAFDYNPFFGKNWEEQKLQEIMETERKKQSQSEQHQKQE